MNFFKALEGAAIRGITRYSAGRIHPTKKGPGRSRGMKPGLGKPGAKLEKKAFQGVLGLRNGIGGAGRLAQQGHWLVRHH
ncbi:MAG: hypothetical protein E6Q97_33640 [Desulfurellales bacterium]|nr:MAG: hypothetical protein E6Q97_33640 [Desulfurellales bacterium]